MKRVVIMSGGLDSAVTLAYVSKKLKGEVYPFHIRMESKQNKKEYPVLLEFLKDYKTKKLVVAEVVTPWLQNHAMYDNSIMLCDESDFCCERGLSEQSDKLGWVVPYRNLFPMGLAASYAASIGAEEIWCGFEEDEEADKNCFDMAPTFVATFNRLMKEGNNGWKDIILKSAIVGKTKAQIVKMGLSLGVDFSKTWTCLNDLDKSCGVCGACITRVRAFNEIKIEDPVGYVSEDAIDDILQGA